MTTKHKKYLGWETRTGKWALVKVAMEPCWFLRCETGTVW